MGSVRLKADSPGFRGWLRIHELLDGFDEDHDLFIMVSKLPFKLRDFAIASPFVPLRWSQIVSTLSIHHPTPTP